MSEDNASPPEGEAIPGGFESVDKLFAEFQRLKEDLTEHKTRKATVSELEAKLKAYEEERQARLDAERTELEKAEARAAQLKKELEDRDHALKAAQRATLFEKVFAERAAGLDDKNRKMKRLLYEAAVKTSEGFEDEETLSLLLDPVDELLKPEETGQTVIQQPGSSQQAAPTGKFADMMKMDPVEVMRAAKERKRSG